MQIESFQVIGISIRTTNENGQSSQDIPALWQRFFAENIANQIPNKLDDTIYSVYTDYERDYTKPYTIIIGCKVAHLKEIPPGMVGKTIPRGNFLQFTAKGDINKGAVFHEWLKIWSMDIQRSYSVDFEVYGEKAKDRQHAEVDIFISVVNP